MAKLQNITSQTLIKSYLVVAFVVASSPVSGQVCYDNTSTLNSSNYSLNQPLQTTPGFPLSFYNGSMIFNASLSGTAVWSLGVQVQKDASVGDLIFLQPRTAADYLNTSNESTYILTFPSPSTSFSARFGGLNNFDGTTIIASYQGVSVPITAANFSNFSFDSAVGYTLKDADGNGQIDTVVAGASTNGGTSVVSNQFTLTINSQIDRLTIVSGKDEVGNNGNVTIGFHTFNYCVRSPILRIVKFSNGPWTIGQSGAQYSLNVTNIGNNATSGTITVRDVLPTGVTPNWTGSLSTSGFSCTFSGQAVTCTRSSVIASSGTAAIILPVTIGSSTPLGINSITNYASIGGGGDVFNGGSAPTPGTTCTNTTHCSNTQTTVNAPPNVGLVKSWTSPTCSSNCTITNVQQPGSDITFKIVFTNSGGQGAANLTIVDAVPSNMDYKLISAATNVGTSGLTFAIEFSPNYDPLNPTLATWTYTPVTAGGGASAGYDRLVKAVRWRVTSGTLSFTSPNNTGDVSFAAKIR